MQSRKSTEAHNAEWRVTRASSTANYCLCERKRRQMDKNGRRSLQEKKDVRSITGSNQKESYIPIRDPYQLDIITLRSREMSSRARQRDHANRWALIHTSIRRPCRRNAFQREGNPKL